MATKAQITANRKNARGHATGPRTPSGIARTKLNGLKHGLRSQEVVLPTESAAAFQEHLDAWMAEWKPTTMARAQLVEDAAIAAWRKKRCVRVEAARAGRRIDAALARWRQEEAAKLDRALEDFHEDPRPALDALLASRAGIDRLIAMWAEVAEAATAEGWSDPDDHHFRLIALHGRRPADPDMIDLRDASWRLLLRNLPEDWQEEGDEPWGDDEAESVAAQIRITAGRRIEALRALREARPDTAAHWARHAEAEAFQPTAGDAALLRYEGQLTRQFHRALADLVKLTESGADLVEEPEAEAEAEAPTEANSAEASDGEGVKGGFSGPSPAAAVVAAPATAPARPAGDPGGPVRASGGAPAGPDPAPNRI